MAKAVLCGFTAILLACYAQSLTPNESDVLLVPLERGIQLISLPSNRSTTLLSNCEVLDVAHDPIQAEIYALAECQEGDRKVILKTNGIVEKTLNIPTSFKSRWDSRLLQMTEDHPVRIGFDWIGRNLYISTSCGALRLCNIDSLNCATIQHRGKAAVHLALDPQRGFVFWGTNRSKSIFRADLDGSGMKTIWKNLTSSGAFELNGEQGRLYWKSLDASVVESCDTDGKDFQAFESITDTTPFYRVFQSSTGDKMYFIRLLGNRYLFVRLEDRSEKGEPITWLFSGFRPYPDHLTMSALLLRNSPFQPWTKGNVSSACVDRNCSHICVLSAGRGHSCLCDEGFHDNSLGNCVAFEEKLLVATSRDLYAIGLNNGTVRKQEIRDPSEYDIRVVAFDIGNQFVFSATTVREHTRIIKRHFDSRDIATIVLNLKNAGVKNSYELQVLAYDWITGNMYMVFENARRIHACNLTAKVCVELLGNQVGKDVGGLALHPSMGSMFWTQRDKDNCAIMRARMDGSAPKTIRTEGVDQPAGIAIDFENSLIFWLDLSKGQVESTDLHGNNYKRIFVTKKKYMLRHIVLHPGKGIYLAGNATGLSGGNGAGVLLKQFEAKETILFSLPNAPISGIAIRSFRSQPKSSGNPCENRTCAGLCLLSGDSFQCACPEGMILKSNGVACEEREEPIVIYSAGNGISVCRNTCEHEILAIESNKVKSVSYSNHHRTLFWTTDEQIWEAYIGSGEATNSTVLVHTKGIRILKGSLQYDWVGDNIYFISERNGLVGLCSRLSSTCTMLDSKIITKLGSTVALEPMRGRMYWCADEGIQSSGMDGSYILKLTEGPCQGPLATDGDSLFFASQGALRSSDLDGGNIHTLIDLGSNPEMLVVAGPAVFWTLHSYPVATVYSCDKITANNLRVHKVTVRSPILDIHVAYKGSQSLRKRNPCHGGGLCSHICALTSTGYMRCLCPEGLQLAADAFNCTAAGVTVQKDTAVTFDQDGRRRCPSGDQFGCLTFKDDGGCVNMSQVCDGVPDCPDVSDEGQRCNELCLQDPECDHGCVPSPIGPLCSCLFDERWDDTRQKCVRFLLENDALATKSLQVALSVVAGIAISLLLVAGIAVRKYRQAQEKMRNLTPEEIQEFLRGNQATADAAADGVEKAMALPYQCSITPGSLDYARDTVLGSGEFGVVHPGVWNNTESVAVKTFKRTVGIEEFKAILAEVKIMTYLGQHSHIVKYLGADVSEIAQRKIVVVTELSPYGDLLRHLRTVSVSKVSSGILIHWCQQIADGMEYLTTKQIVHGDLAARNILVFQDDVVKISDFGLSKQLYGCGQYIMRRQGKIPWKWASIELLTCSEFSEASDVWAFGVTAWEIFTLGQTPYKGMRPGEHFVQYLRQGNRLDKPSHAPEAMQVNYKMLLKCWDLEKDYRPMFSTLNDFLQEQLASFKNNQSGNSGANIESSYVVAH